MAVEDPINRGGIIYKKYKVTRLDDESEPINVTYFPVKIGTGGTTQALIGYLQKLMQDPKHQSTPFVGALWSLARQKTFKGFRNNDIKPLFKVEKLIGTTDPYAKYFVFEISEDKYARDALLICAEAIAESSPRMSRNIKELIKAKNWKAYGYIDEINENEE